MKKISICIPTYEMNMLGATFLEQSFIILTKQTFKDFNVIISDHSKDNAIQDLCERYKQFLDITYIRNELKRGNSSANINNAIAHADGELIKILFQDDFLFDDKSLEHTVTNFDITKDSWLVSACVHTTDGQNFYRPFYPKYNKQIYLGNNTISSPSVLTIKNNIPLLFDESLIWLMDVEYYKGLYDIYGEPKILNTITVVNRVGTHQVSNTLATKRVRFKEYVEVLSRYERGVSFWYYKVLGFLKGILK
jgi:glycosyltransferase involved in cell wall biosynthesis